MKYRWFFLWIFFAVHGASHASELSMRWTDDWQYEILDKTALGQKIVAIRKDASGVVNQSFEMQVVHLQSTNQHKPVTLTMQDIKQLAEKLRGASVALTDKQHSTDVLPLPRGHGYYFTYIRAATEGATPKRKHVTGVAVVPPFLLTFSSQILSENELTTKDVLMLVGSVHLK